MSAYYSKFLLNTYAMTPYFQAHMPESYQLYKVLRKSRTFHNLPPKLRELSALAKQWAIRHYGPPAGAIDIEMWYDAEGFEINPDTGIRLTADEIASEWKPEPELDDFVVVDLEEPAGGFADPTTWKEKVEEPEDEDYHPSPAQVLSDLESHGSKAVATTYGLPEAEADEDFVRRADAVLASDYLTNYPAQRKLLIEAVSGADIYDDLGGIAKEVFDRVEVYQRLVGS